MHEIRCLYESGRDLLEVLNELIAVDREPVSRARRRGWVRLGVSSDVSCILIEVRHSRSRVVLSSHSLLILVVIFWLVHVIQSRGWEAGSEVSRRTLQWGLGLKVGLSIMTVWLLLVPPWIEESCSELIISLKMKLILMSLVSNLRTEDNPVGLSLERNLWGYQSWQLEDVHQNQILSV